MRATDSNLFGSDIGLRVHIITMPITYVWNESSPCNNFYYILLYDSLTHDMPTFVLNRLYSRNNNDTHYKSVILMF